MIPLSDSEASILLGATLMHWGVPFHHAVRHELSDGQQSMVDAASSKLIAWREEYRKHPLKNPQAVDFTDNEIALLLEVVEDCLAECGKNATEIRLQLQASSRQEVEILASRLRQFVALSSPASTAI